MVEIIPTQIEIFLPFNACDKVPHGQLTKRIELQTKTAECNGSP